MARETKAALILGLVFIVCFAAILMRRGREPKVDKAVGGPNVVDPGTVAGGPVNGSQAARQPDGNPDLPPVPPDHPANALAKAPGQPATENLSTDSSAPVNGDAPPHSATGMDASAAERKERLQRLLDEDGRRSGRGASPDEALPPTVTLADAQKDTGAPAAKESHGTHKPPSNVDSASAIHKVEKGETLMAIARRHYGAEWKRGLDALVDANKPAVRNVDEIREGMQLKVPALNRTDPRSTRSAPPAAQVEPRSGSPTTLAAKDGSGVKTPPKSASPAKPSTGDSAGTTSPAGYKVKPGDTYMSIARSVLGDEKRWVEIHALNRDRFPDPSNVREGAQLRMPSKPRSVSRNDSA